MAVSFRKMGLDVDYVNWEDGNEVIRKVYMLGDIILYCCIFHL